MNSRYLTVLGAERLADRKYRIAYIADGLSDVVEVAFEEEPQLDSWIISINDKVPDLVAQYPDLARRFFQAAVEVALGVRDAPVTISDDEDLDWRTLAREMSEISEQAFCAGWMDGLEYRLWAIVQGGPRKYGQLVLTDARVTRLRDLSDKLHGWVRFNDESEVEEFVGSERWQSLYEGWAHSRSGPRDRD